MEMKELVEQCRMYGIDLIENHTRMYFELRNFIEGEKYKKEDEVLKSKIYYTEKTLEEEKLDIIENAIHEMLVFKMNKSNFHNLS